MYTLIFGAVWTVLSAAMLVGLHLQPEFQNQTLFFKTVMTLMPVAGILPIWDGWKRIRRHGSVRVDRSDTTPTYTWTDRDGSIRRSAVDPRPAWEAEDRNFAD